MFQGAHQRLSASKTEQWWTCPGSIAVLEAKPDLDEGSSRSAQQGTAAHHLVEVCLNTNTNPTDYLNRIITIKEGQNNKEDVIKILGKHGKAPTNPQAVWFEVDPDMVNATTHMVSYVRNRMKELNLTDSDLAVEMKVVPLPHRTDTGGSADVILDAWPELLEVIDYKHGSGVFVPVEGNKQLRSYGLGALLHYGAENYERVQYTICQPRHYNAPENGIMTETVAVSELLDWQKELSARADRVDEAREVIKKGEGLDALFAKNLLSAGDDSHPGKGCTFCQIAPHCPALISKTKELAAADFEDEPDKLSVDLSLDGLARVLPWLSVISAWVKAVQVKADKALIDGKQHSDGMKVVRKRGRRSYTTGLSVDQIVTKLSEICPDMPQSEMVKPKELISLTEMEKAVVRYGAKKSALSEVLQANLGSLTVVPSTDRREAVDMNPAADFKDEDADNNG